MANILSVNQQQAISSLAAQGWSILRIAREPGQFSKVLGIGGGQDLPGAGSNAK